ncbi:MAG: tRNA preQ1(34) S-adenosylmethionine ribosyltransferase-isomerase QueA [Bdellovibrio sp.]|nr:tRNA preQ1(34) S-adenosylmethionine ribosyltransferase-isomerase QueA [Bdellovibrio sp.]
MINTNPYALESYNYNLPAQLIAQEPLEKRDTSRLMVLNRKQKTWQHYNFNALPEILNSNDVLIANNSKVLRARLLGYRVIENNRSRFFLLGGKVEFLLLKELEHCVWEGAFHASAKPKKGLKFFVQALGEEGLLGEIVRPSFESQYGTVVVKFNINPLKSQAAQVPLPPYIDRAPSVQDLVTYQTIYAKKEGSSAAPTAGFHFTSELMQKLKEKKIAWQEITLHVGLGTFRPVKTLDIREHKMHEEDYEISQTVAQKLAQYKKESRRFVAVGTTTLRTLESGIKPGLQKTNLFLYPGCPGCCGNKVFPFKIVDALITNFHLPRSTLLMLVCAFAGRDYVLSAYEEAIRQRYRFYSYGDAMLIV